MSVRFVDPEHVVRVPVHHQVSVAQGTRIVSMAGQVSWDAEGRLVGAGDLAAQAEQSWLNVAAALAGAGATIADVARATVYIVGLDPARVEQVMEGRRRAEERLDTTFEFPGTYIGVGSLFDPAYLIEIEATAVLD